ncbi:hypothetical protein SAJA_02870 [Salinisphaera japonica YTM-1]|uniref:Uncharacterized protein n=1 Tax=Salinisphaera japonica YTM-1 TaxID=1209778 RepID=A0A423Q0K8_9GAMM|nr:hypothetical protein SAJA_02870 [Salinisphaera japonica YTM-1]
MKRRFDEHFSILGFLFYLFNIKYLCFFPDCRKYVFSEVKHNFEIVLTGL